MKQYYVSLVHGLLGYFVLFEAPDEFSVRWYCKEYFGKLWCGVYTSIPKEVRKKDVINPDNPIELGDWVKQQNSVPKEVSVSVPTSREQEK